MRQSLVVLTLSVVAWAALACAPSAPPPALDPETAPDSVPGAPAVTTLAAADPALEPRDGLMDPLSREEREWIERTLASLSTRQRIAQMVSVWVLGDYVNTEAPTFQELRRQVAEDGIGGIIMSLGSPIEVAAKVNSLQRLASVPLLVSSDLEPGLGRLEGGVFVPSLMSAGSATILPSNMALGAGGRAEDARAAGRVVGREALATGIHLVFAPVADVNNNPANPVINVRSFGEDPALVGALTGAFVEGIQGAGAMATVKHFPGHGDTGTDSHLALPVVTSSAARLDSVELVPFRSAIAAGVAGVMSAHIALPAIEPSGIPATLAPRVMTALLRDSLGFDGLAVTDALTMEGIGEGYSAAESAVLAVQAGADVLLMPRSARQTIDAVEAAVRSGAISEARIEASVRRLLEWKVRTNAVARPIVSLEALRRVVAAPEHQAVARSIADRSITLIRDRQNAVPLARGGRIVALVYASEGEITAGRAFVAGLRAGGTVATVRLGPGSSPSQLDSIGRSLQPTDAVVVSTHVRRIEGVGRTAVAPFVAGWIETLAMSRPVTVVAFGNPYAIRQFPTVGAYVATFSMAPVSEEAAAAALLGRTAITGMAPVSLPGIFSRGDGVRRAVRR